ncbi:GIY-YIG nuclease family protein [Clostridium perfringens]
MNNNNNCPKCGQAKENKERYWCKKCACDYKKEWTQRKKRPFIYVIYNGEEVLYIGITEHLNQRITNHTCGYVKTTRELFKSKEWTHISALDVGKLVNNVMELRAIENELISVYRPKYNKFKNRIAGIDELRLFELCCVIHQQKEWEIVKKNTN